MQCRHKSGHTYEKIFKEEQSIEILKVLGLTNNKKSIRKYIIMPEENISQAFRLENIDETRSYLIEETNRNRLMSKKHEEVCTNYIERFLILASVVTRCVSISAFSPLIGISIGITSSAIRLKICAIIAEIKKSINQ